ncbi:hypothetical protein RFI_25409 [Reticulomyxa filosa]|uniref:Uncharacterized protein n=1 Tax=Reticulomyxa filosa TaxID=46433 RepID=X6ME93_RETFI|nr:hypothetical protein RFI_25409 [Reticulomyxa filosa]|eukprot:ETO11966.1 hypothetical protein RFI_25409 [Reticulomyxa filosa]
MLVFPNDKANLFVFHYYKKHPIITYQSDNEKLFDIEKEYKGFAFPRQRKQRYARIEGAMQMRHMKHVILIPDLTWKDRQLNVVGMTSQHCAQDDEMLEYIDNANKNHTILYVMDDRPKINAQFNKAKAIRVQRCIDGWRHLYN